MKKLGGAEFVNLTTRENFQSYSSDFLHKVVQWERRSWGGGGRMGDLVVAFCKI